MVEHYQKGHTLQPHPCSSVIEQEEYFSHEHHQTFDMFSKSSTNRSTSVEAPQRRDHPSFEHVQALSADRHRTQALSHRARRSYHCRTSFYMTCSDFHNTIGIQPRSSVDKLSRIPIPVATSSSKDRISMCSRLDRTVCSKPSYRPICLKSSHAPISAILQIYQRQLAQSATPFLSRHEKAKRHAQHTLFQLTQSMRSSYHRAPHLIMPSRELNSARRRPPLQLHIIHGSEKTRPLCTPISSQPGPHAQLSSFIFSSIGTCISTYRLRISLGSNICSHLGRSFQKSHSKCKGTTSQEYHIINIHYVGKW